MDIRAHVVFLAFAAASPVWAMAAGDAADGALTAKAPGPPPWKHRFGFRLGASLFYGEWGAVFYENQIDGHWAIRPSIELMTATESYYRDAAAFGTTDVDVDRVGVGVECLYYASRRGQHGTKLYLLAGLGLHSINMKDKYGTWNGREMVYGESSDVAPAVSVGLGYHFGRYFGVEYRQFFSTLSAPFPGDVGKNWSQFTINIRFPVPGAPK